MNGRAATGKGSSGLKRYISAGSSKGKGGNGNVSVAGVGDLCPQAAPTDRSRPR